MEERNQEVLALRAIFDAAFEAESPHLWRVEVDLAGGDGSGGAREAVLAALGPCALEIHIPPQNRCVRGPSCRHFRFQEEHLLCNPRLAVSL